MGRRKPWFRINEIVAVFAIRFAGGRSLAASMYKQLPRYKAGADGGYRAADLTSDAAVNLYGTAGAVVFELKPNTLGAGL